MTLILASACLVHRCEAQVRDRFDHWQHRELFPSCISCHTAVEDQAKALWPRASACSSCHNGIIEETVTWKPPSNPPATNLRFTHGTHATAVDRVHPDSLLNCRACHVQPGSDPMEVRLAVAQNCLDCHGIRASHLEAPDSSCGTCHVPLSQAVRLVRSDVGEFPTPRSHKAPNFVLKEHGGLARSGGATGVSAACATCHARDFCTECHVNAPEVPVIQALAADPRSLAHKANLKAPPDHESPAFLRRHGSVAGKSAKSCATCHTQESCLACHTAAAPSAVFALPAAGARRGRGAVIARERPASHGADFSEQHGPNADSRPETCSGCHVRTQCLDCHRPNPADPTPGYHPAGFLGRHPAAAYSRETSCSDCHNTGQFCAECHVNAGLSASGPLDAGYHDAKRSFVLGHGQAARQNLESCVACHAERDCLTCHSAQGGRRFNPHGPGFDPATLQRKNSQACTACHGAQIPSSSP